MKNHKLAIAAIPDEFPEHLKPYLHKTLHYRYWGRDYHFASSQELFSATQIDRGSQLLLQSLLPLPSPTNLASANIQAQAQGALQHFLEQSLHQSADKTQCFEIWDWGCGIGPLGIMAQGYCSQVFEKYNKLRLQQGYQAQDLHCELRIFDRDALALAFAQANWQGNIKSQLGFSPSLHVAASTWGEEELFTPTEANTKQLVLGNIPAKLGEPVLRQVLPALAATSASYVAIVIVAPLRRILEEAARQAQIEILYQSGSGDHCVFHYRQGYRALGLRHKLPDILKLYKRSESCFALERKGKAFDLRKADYPSTKEPSLRRKDHKIPAKWLLRWPFCSAYGLPDFDSPSFGLQLQLRLLAQQNWGSRVLLWEPGHGHFACFLALKSGSHLKHIDFASRNRLSLAFSQHNLQNLRNFLPEDCPLPQSDCHHLPSLECMEGFGWDLIIVVLENELSQPKALRNWLERLPHSSAQEKRRKHGNDNRRAVDERAKPDKSCHWLCIQGRSHLVQQLQLQHLRGWIPPKANAKEELRAHGLLTQLWHY